MDISQKMLGYMLAAAIVVGAGLGVWYDVLRLSRMLVGLDPPAAVRNREGEGRPRPARSRRAVPARLLQWVEDCLFGLSCGLALILLLYYTNDGGFRAMAVFGMAAGYALYRWTAGKLFDRWAPRLVGACHALLRWVMRLLLFPLRVLARCWQRTLGAAIHRSLARRRERIGRRNAERAYRAYIEAAADGFGLRCREEKNS